MGNWSQGRPVFKKVDRETRYLFVKDGISGAYGAWYVMDSTTVGSNVFVVHYV